MRIYVLGDSISLHYGPYLESYLKGVMGYARKEGGEEAALNLDNPQGSNGGDSGMVLSFLKARAGTGGIEADVLLLNCGLHDIKTDPATGLRQVPLDRYRENLGEILEAVRAMRLQLVWIRTTPCDERVHNSQPDMTFHRFARDCAAYNAAADTVMENAGIPAIDLFTFTANLGAELFCDHVHFHESVRMKQAAFIAGWLMGKFIPGQ
ncbi:MAG: SGNH/GDSL hydrolase family protein [Rectinemataceae bacterium]